MSGHSKWHKVKHKKAVTDSKKSKSFGRLSRDIKIAARAGKDPTRNAALREAIERAKRENLPQANIDRLLRDNVANQQPAVYEGYGAGGVAILVTAETDNTNRTVAELRSLFKKHQGALGKPGSVRWKFSASYTVPAEQRLVITPEQHQLLRPLVEALEEREDVIDVYTDAAVE